MPLEPTIFAVDDDAAITTTILQLGKLIDLQVETFASAHEFLEEFDPSKPGALTFLEKPFRIQVLCDHIQQAISLDLDRRRKSATVFASTNRLSLLSNKEWEVVELLIVGKTNKAIASELGLSRRGIEDRRARIMKKLNLKAVAELVETVATARAS